jgi:hypothetical protein
MCPLLNSLLEYLRMFSTAACPFFRLLELYLLVYTLRLLCPYLLRTEKTKFEEGMWNVNTVFMGGLGRDPHIEGT